RTRQGIPSPEELRPPRGVYPAEALLPPSPSPSKCCGDQSSSPCPRLNLRSSMWRGTVRRGRRLVFVGKLPLERRFPNRVLFSPGACVGHGELIVSSRVFRDDFSV